MKKILRILSSLLLIASFTFIIDVKAEEMFPTSETLSVWWTNPSGGGGQNVNNFSTTPPSYPFIKRFRVHYGNGQFGNTNFTGDLCFSTSFGVKAPNDLKDIKNYNKLDNWTFGSNTFYLRYVDVYNSNNYLYYTFYMQNNSNITGFYFSTIDLYYTGTINPYFTNQSYTFSFTTPVTRFVSCSSISDNMIDSELDNLHSEIDDRFNDIDNKIDDMQDNIIDNANQNHEKAEETRKGIWASLTEGISNIGKWFSDLASSIGNFFAELGKSISDGFSALTLSIGDFFSNLFKDIKSLFVGEEVCETVPPKIDNLVKYEGVEPDSEGWYTYTCTSSTCPQWTVPYIDTIENATYYNSFFEIKDLESVGNYRIHPYFSYSGQYGDSGIAPYLVQNGSLSFIDTSIISKDNVLFNKRTIYAYLNSSSYFTKLSVTNLKGSSLSFKFRILVTDDMSMTVDNYEYPLPKNECTNKGGLFGMITSFIDIVKNGFTTLLSGILDGIKALFVPTDDQLFEIIDDSKELTENFGFVGQSVSFFITILTSLLGLVNANGCLELPEFSIGETSLFDSHKFWDKQTVCLNDNAILSSNITVIRTITSIVLVCMFINFAASKFFTILSKNDYSKDTTDYEGRRLK